MHGRARRGPTVRDSSGNGTARVPETERGSRPRGQRAWLLGAGSVPGDPGRQRRGDAGGVVDDLGGDVVADDVLVVVAVLEADGALVEVAALGLAGAVGVRDEAIGGFELEAGRRRRSWWRQS